MAIRYAVANGNWSNVATWDGGTTLPGAGDDVYADGKTVTIDQNITVDTLYTTQRSGGTSGGGFTCDTSGRTINANSVSGTQNCLTFIHATGLNTVNGTSTGGISGYSCGITNNGGGSLNINGTVNGGVGGVQTHGVANNGAGTVTINGYINASTVYNYGYGVYNGSSGVINFYGTLDGKSSSCIYNNSGGTINIFNDVTQLGGSPYGMIRNRGNGVVNLIGNVIGSLLTTPSVCNVIYQDGGGSVYITGDVIVNSVAISSFTGIIYNLSVGLINITGEVIGGSVSNAIAVSNNSTGTIVVTGNVTGGSHIANTPAIYSTSAGIIDVAGNVIAGAYPAIYSTNIAARNKLSGYITNTAKIQAIHSMQIEVSQSAGQVVIMQELVNGTDRSFSTTNVAGGLPQVTDVRYGTQFGPINEYTGTCKVPTPDKVLLGNDVDNTVGTLLMSPEDFWNYAQANITEGIGARLKNCSTVETVGEQIVSLNQQ